MIRVFAIIYYAYSLALHRVPKSSSPLAALSSAAHTSAIIGALARARTGDDMRFRRWRWNAAAETRRRHTARRRFYDYTR